MFCRNRSLKGGFVEIKCLEFSCARGGLPKMVCEIEQLVNMIFIYRSFSHIHCIYQYNLLYNPHIIFYATLLDTFRHVVQNHQTVIVQ